MFFATWRLSWLAALYSRSTVLFEVSNRTSAGIIVETMVMMTRARKICFLRDNALL